MLVREITDYLIQNEFQRIEKHNVEELDLLYYKNKSINVFLGNQDYLSFGYNEINDLSCRLRETLISNNINVYNSYLIYCIDENLFSKEEIILLERSSKFLRKYIIGQIEDLNRIFFLNKINLEFEISKDTPPRMNEEIKEIVNLMLDEEEKIVRLKSSQVQLISENILEKLGGSYED